MFDISWGKLVIIGVVALLVIGPKELPMVLRTVGQWMSKIRRMASEFQGQFQDAMREAEMADIKKQFDETTSTLQSTFDPSGEHASARCCRAIDSAFRSGRARHRAGRTCARCGCVGADARIAAAAR